ncbi:MAG: Three-deoxy-D-manno-octulosonic-acid transferase protein [Chitinophagaceae bacterium]|nr:Three-deoxy-D-manno-octulosonic-acid transferase protein [Chitinophagaceae bacterium]
MYLLLYNISLLAFRAGIRVAALMNPKAKLWLRGRKNIFETLEQTFSKGQKMIWFHCASLGEFEQGRPVLEKIKADYPQHAILVTFFSPSGYEVRKDYKQADYIFYLPLDSAANAKRFLEIVNPSLVIFVKYEFWFYYFKNIRERKIPFLLLSAVFRNNQVFFKWYGSLYRKMLHSFTHLFVQDHHSKELLKTIGFEQNVSVAGDTRFDRVAEIAEKFEPLSLIESFCNDQKVIVAGSTWPDDENILNEVFSTIHDASLKLIIAPHETGINHLDQLKNIFPSAVFYSALETHLANVPAGRPEAIGTILIIDHVGLLSRLYHYGHITYVGGGFTRDGIHNILEAAAYGRPVVFGPVYKKYREAIELIEAEGAQSFSTAGQLKQLFFTLLNDPVGYNQKCEASKRYVELNKGATARILRFIQEKRLLTN